MNVLRGSFAIMLLAPLASAAEMKVATLHPLLTDLLKRVGGERVEVIDLVGADGDPHRFEPSARELRAVEDARLFFVSGKGLEPYLPKLRDIVGDKRVVEVGAPLPTLKATSLCAHGEHDHVHEVDDPHWWHSIDCWKRAAVGVARELGKIDPSSAAGYLDRAVTFRTDLEKLDVWVRAELDRVPKERRTLATAHAAFAYFCNEFEWKMLAVQGLNREQEEAPNFAGEVAKAIRAEQVGAVFPEQHANPKMLTAIAKEVGVPVGEPLMADGGESIEGMFRHNVEAIVAALAPKQDGAQPDG